MFKSATTPRRLKIITSIATAYGRSYCHGDVVERSGPRWHPFFLGMVDRGDAVPIGDDETIPVTTTIILIDATTFDRKPPAFIPPGPGLSKREILKAYGWTLDGWELAQRLNFPKASGDRTSGTLHDLKTEKLYNQDAVVEWLGAMKAARGLNLDL